MCVCVANREHAKVFRYLCERAHSVHVLNFYTHVCGVCARLVWRESQSARAVRSRHTRVCALSIVCVCVCSCVRHAAIRSTIECVRVVILFGKLVFVSVFIHRKSDCDLQCGLN